MSPNIVINRINSWRVLRKADWPRLTSINIEDNKATEIAWLAELNTSEKMGLFCVESIKESQKIYNYSYCGKLKMAETNDLCKNSLVQGY